MKQPHTLRMTLVLLALTGLATVWIPQIPDEFDARAVDKREYFTAEVLFIDLIDLGCDLQWHAGSPRNPDRAIRTLFRRNPSEEGKVSSLPEQRSVQISRNAVVDRRHEFGVGQCFALVVRDSNQRHFAEARVEGPEVPQILSTVECGQGPTSQRVEKREMEQIDVKMKNVKFLRILA